MTETKLELTEVGPITVVLFKGESILDMTEIQQIGERLDALVEKLAAPKLVLDFEGVRFLSSQTLGVLINLRKKVQDRGGKLALCGLRPELARVFKITNLDRMFSFHDARAAALENLGSA